METEISEEYYQKIYSQQEKCRERQETIFRAASKIDKKYSGEKNATAENTYKEIIGNTVCERQQ